MERYPAQGIGGAPRPRPGSGAQSEPVGRGAAAAGVGRTSLGGGAPAPAAGGAAGGVAGGAAPKRTEQDVQAIWKLLDRRNAGEVHVSDIVQNSVVIKRKCPELLEGYGRAAHNGKLTLADLRRFMLGPGSADKGAARRHGGSGVKPGDAYGGATRPAREMSSEDLQHVWAQLNPQGRERIGLPDILEHASWLQKDLPEVVDKFEEIDSDGNMEVSFDDLCIFFSTEAWLEAELKAIVGLNKLKEQLVRFHRSVMLDRKRAADGHDVSTGGKLHMIFRGNPGTGKTSMGRLMAKLLHRVGALPTAALKEVQRPDLVAEYVGQTGPKTRKIIEESRAGLLFIDEAYRLSSGGKTDFGREAIEELMASMNEPPGKAPVQIYAGYPDDMEKWMRANEGLYRRIAYTFDFEDYSPDELAAILGLYVKQKGFALEPALTGEQGIARMGAMIARYTVPRTRQLMNGGLSERIFAGAKQLLDARDDPAHPSIVLTEADLVAACTQIPPPPEPERAGVENHQGAPTLRPVVVAAASPQESGVKGVVGCQVSSHRFLVVRAHDACLSDPRRGACVVSTVQPMNPYVVVSFAGSDGHSLRQAWKSAKAKKGHVEPSWEEVAVLPVQPHEHLVQVAVYDRHRLSGERFLGSTQLALSAVPEDGWTGQLELRNNNKKSGTLRAEMCWQSADSGTAVAALDRALFGKTS